MTSVRATSAPARWYTVFSFLSSWAEGGQAVVLLWLTYSLTSNAFLIGVMIVLGYLPAAVLGLLFRRFADRGRAERVAGSTNAVLSGVSLALTVEQLLAGRAVALAIVVIAASQVVLSVAKMVNKAALNRLVRDVFPPGTAKRVLEVSSSASLIGQVVGAGLAGVFLSANWTAAGLLVSALAYGTGALALTFGLRRPAREEMPEPPVEVKTRAALPAGIGLVLVLVFSVPSSGALQFLNTLLVPLADDIAHGHPSFYAVLNVVSVAGGFLAGLALSTRVITTEAVLRWGLPTVAVFAALLGFITQPWLVAVTAFVLSLVITCHVICMQVLTNQVPADSQVGQFAVLRNVVAALAKAVFSFAAGAVVGWWGVRTAAVALAATTLVFAVAWFVARGKDKGHDAAHG
ncbi:putative MFS family arabinose efflux permease [Amycolatopsis bartoniae]|nr:MFS transporter [Amycolatopsis bartoniae]MBB2938607.1 putative MFS family arabinose efflux permease [Amycolatopsis bartoniae]TVT08893.1 MFS transporter [Amycolatopsis bartoniae]